MKKFMGAVYLKLGYIAVEDLESGSYTTDIDSIKERYKALKMDDLRVVLDISREIPLEIEYESEDGLLVKEEAFLLSDIAKKMNHPHKEKLITFFLAWEAALNQMILEINPIEPLVLETQLKEVYTELKNTKLPEFENMPLILNSIKNHHTKLWDFLQTIESSRYLMYSNIMRDLGMSPTQKVYKLLDKICGLIDKYPLKAPEYSDSKEIRIFLNEKNEYLNLENTTPEEFIKSLIKNSNKYPIN